MADTFYRESFENPVQLDFAPVPIHPNGAGALAEAPVPASAAAVRAFINDELNSRLPVPLAGGGWKVAWSVDLPLRLQPQAILTDGKHVVLQGKSDWQLLDRNGKTVASGLLGPGNIVLDPMSNWMLLPSPESRVSAYQLDTGRPFLVLSGYFGENFSRAYIAPRGSGIVLVSIERSMDFRGSYEPNLSAIERYDFGVPPQIGRKALLLSSKRTADLLRRTVQLRAAMHGDTLVMAVPGAVYLADTELRLRAEMVDDFEPVAMSLDEAAQVYLVARTPRGTWLWCLTPRGERRFAVELPEGWEPVSPPVVGYDHRVYLAARDRIRCVDPAGKVLWEEMARGGLAGAAVTPDHELLVSEGHELSIWNGLGERRTLYRFDGEALVTAPVATGDGAILVASRTRCYRLEAKPAQPPAD